jgi:hypothetical protein
VETSVSKLTLKEIKRSTLVLLGILFLSYVVGDYITTAWLIHNDPVGIDNETNLVASTLYKSFGHPGLLIVKLAAFIAIGGVVYFVEMKFPWQPRINRLKKFVVLALIGYSLVVLANNMYAIFTLSTA